MLFTQLTVDRVRPPTNERVLIWDTATPGFGIRISPSRKGSPATKVYVGVSRHDGKPKWRTIGRCDTMQLREAKAEYRIIREKSPAPVENEQSAGQQTTHLRSEVNVRRDEEATFGFIAQCYIAKVIEKKNKPTTVSMRKAIFNQHLLPEFGDNIISDLRPRDIGRLIEALEEKGYSAGLLNNVFGLVKTFSAGCRSRMTMVSCCQ